MARRIPEPILQEIRDRTDIAGLVSEYVTLKKSGRNYKGLCPFHQEKTPSFNVSPERDIFHCFGCGAGGNVFTFLMRMEGMSFVEAVRNLARRAGVELPAPTAEDAARATQREKLLAVTRRAADLYHRHLLEAPEAEVARRYLAGRGVAETSTASFELGYAPPSWDFLLKKAQASGVSVGDLEAAGLAVRSERAGGHYDRFRGRLIFPIRDHRGEVVGFGGRLLEPEAKEAKYINTPETVLYNKSRLLYGMDKGRRAAQEAEDLLVTEGYLDVITGHQYGLENIVATLGTALTEDHARLIGRYAHQVTLVFDADQAGAAATRRGADLLVERGIQVYVMTLPAGEDPDSYIRSAGLEAFEAARQDAKPLVEFLLADLLRQAGATSAAGKGQAARELLQVVGRIPNRVEQDETFRLIAVSLGVREEALREEFRRMRAEERRPRTAKPAVQPAEREAIWAEEVLLLRILLQEPGAAEAAASTLSPETLKDEQLQAILRALFSAAPRGEVDIAGLLNQLPDPAVAARAVQLAETPHGLEDFQAGLNDCLDKIEERALREQVRELEQALKEAEKAGNRAAVNELSRRRIELQRTMPA